MKTFKNYLNEFAGAPSAGGPAAAPNASPAPAPTVPAPPTSTPAQSAAATQSANLGKQIQDLNSKLQKLMQQKAIVDKQLGTQAAAQNQNQQASAQANQAAVAATG